jgi:membrane-bound ClpP family serine protease
VLLSLAFLAVLGAETSLDDFDQTGESTPQIRFVLQISLEEEAITPVTARFICRAIRRAETERAECLIIVLDTPGGLVDSTRSVVKEVLRSDVPVVVYVAPSGARAASAGVFITLASHVAAMAPATNIGAAHPVEIGGLPISPAPRPMPDSSGKPEKTTTNSPDVANGRQGRQRHNRLGASTSGTARAKCGMGGAGGQRKSVGIGDRGGS